MLLIVTEGIDPGASPEEVFSQRIRDAELHKKVWYDFRGNHKKKAKEWSKVRNFDDERIRLAADLNHSTLGLLQPIWYQEECRRERITLAQRIATQSEAVRIEDQPQLSLLLALEASEILKTGDPRVPSMEQALRNSLAFIGGRGLEKHKNHVLTVALSSNNRWLATIRHKLRLCPICQ